jgi:hypothetical protein
MRHGRAACSSYSCHYRSSRCMGVCRSGGSLQLIGAFIGAGLDVRKSAVNLITRKPIDVICSASCTATCRRPRSDVSNRPDRGDGESSRRHRGGVRRTASRAPITGARTSSARANAELFIRGVLGGGFCAPAPAYPPRPQPGNIRSPSRRSEASRLGHRPIAGHASRDRDAGHYDGRRLLRPVALRPVQAALHATWAVAYVANVSPPRVIVHLGRARPGCGLRGLVGGGCSGIPAGVGSAKRRS